MHNRNDPSRMAKMAAFTNSRSKVQAKLPHVKYSLLSANANEIQRFLNRHDMMNFYDALKTVYGTKVLRIIPTSLC